MEGQRRVPVRWGDMAAYTGSRAHALMCWWEIALMNMMGDAEIESPDQGTIPRDVALPLRDILLRHTGRDPCWLGVWSWYSLFEDYQAHVPQPIASFHSRGEREWDLFRAPLDEVFLPVIGRSFVQTANLVWDADRSWWLTTDKDFHSSYIGGGDPLIEAVLGSYKLETWPVAVEDKLAETRRRYWWREFKLSLPQFGFHIAERRSAVFRPRKRRDK